MQNEKVVFVVGGSSGIGLSIVKHLAAKGMKVYSGGRSFKNQEGESAFEDGSVYQKLSVDVTDTDSLNRAVKTILAAEQRIDVLINCAAQICLGAAEDLSIEEYQDIININYLGVIRSCQAVLPVMRQQKSGHIINLSSINGLLATPFTSAYVGSKHAIEGFSEALSLEVKKWGINVTLIEPTDHRNGSKASRKHAKRADDQSSPYYPEYKKVTDKIAHDEETGSDPAGVGELVCKILQTKKPALRYRVGKFDQKLIVVLKKILPTRVFEGIIYGYYLK